MTDNVAETKCRITNIDITDENLTGRAGLSFISRYLTATKIPELLGNKFSYLRKSLKGTNFSSIFHQILSFFINGESLEDVYGISLTSQTAEKVGIPSGDVFIQNR